MQNSVISTWITCLYGSQPSFVVFASKTATLGPDLQVCMCPRPHLWFWAHITAWLAQEKIDYIGSSPHLWLYACQTATLGLEQQASVGPRNDLSFCACTTACFASEILVSMGLSPHLWFLHAKRPVLYPNNECLWVPDLTCHFVHAKQRG